MLCPILATSLFNKLNRPNRLISHIGYIKPTRLAVNLRFRFCKFKQNLNKLLLQAAQAELLSHALKLAEIGLNQLNQLKLSELSLSKLT